MTKNICMGWVYLLVKVLIAISVISLIIYVNIKREEPLSGSPAFGTERYWQDVIQQETGGEKEYRLDDGTRVDLLFPRQACEIDWADKWAEGVGQSIYYGLKTRRFPLVILLTKKDGWEKYRDRVEYCGIECWVFDTRTREWSYRDQLK